MHRYFFLAILITCAFSAWSQARSGLNFHFTDSTTTVASTRYQSNSFLHNFFMGRNYRQQWQTPVKVPLLRLSATPFSIVRLGGGMQTKSLQLKDAAGKIWLLRTVDKEVFSAVPKLLQNTVAYQALQDQISSALPYGAMVVGELAKAAGIVAAKPQMVVPVPDTALGELNEIFAGKFCMLEERDPGFDSTYTTEDVVQYLRQYASHRVDQKTFLKARLLDMLIGDWDRHPGNWRWGRRDSAGFTRWIPVPRDRDWAFYQSGGALPWVAQQTKILRYLISFEPTLKNLKDQSTKAWALDQLFLNDFSWANWETTMQELQTLLNDASIAQAVKLLPTAIYKSIGNQLERTLKSRRDRLREALKRYYRFQSATILLEVPQDADRITVTPAGEDLLVAVTKEGKRIYQRQFNADETTYINIVCNGVPVARQLSKSSIHLHLSKGESKAVASGNSADTTPKVSLP